MTYQEIIKSIEERLLKKEIIHPEKYMYYKGELRRKCSRCRLYVPINHFYKSNFVSEHLQGYCKNCNKLFNRGRGQKF